MIKLSKLLSVLLGDEDIFAEPEEIIPPVQPMDDSESDRDVDIMDLDEPAKEVTNGESNGHSLDYNEPNGTQTNGATDPTPLEPVVDSLPPESIDPQDPAAQPTDSNPLNGNGTALASTTSTPSRSPTPVTRPTTRLQTAATIRPRPTHEEFTWPSSLQQPTTATSAADLGISEQEASEVRRMVQAALERSQEFLRCLEKVRAALVRADKQRKMVWLWCKDSAKLVAEQECEEEQ